MTTIPDAAIDVIARAIFAAYVGETPGGFDKPTYAFDRAKAEGVARRSLADALPHLTSAPQAEGDVREAVDWTRESEHGRCGEWQGQGVPSRCALRVSHQGRHDFERSSSDALVDHIRMSVPAMLPGIAQRIADAVLSSGLVVPVGEVEDLRWDRENLSRGAMKFRNERDAALAAVERVRAALDQFVVGVTFEHGQERAVLVQDITEALDVTTAPTAIPTRGCGTTFTQHHEAGDAIWTCDREVPHERCATRVGETDYVHPVAIPARLLSGEHVGRTVRLPDGRGGVLNHSNVSDHMVVVWFEPLPSKGIPLAPDAVVTLVDEEGGA